VIGAVDSRFAESQAGVYYSPGKGFLIREDEVLVREASKVQPQFKAAGVQMVLEVTG
jgi:hypothetical protein